MAALMARRNGATIGTLETALIDTAFSVVPYQAAAAKLSGERPPRAGSGNPIAAPYQCFRARDGDILIAAPSQRLWEAVVRVLERPQLLDDPRFGSASTRSHNVKALEAAINDALANADVATWIARFTRSGVPVTRVAGLEEAVASDIAAERRTFVASDGVALVRLPWLADGAHLPWARPAPRLGEHTVALLVELGYDTARIAELQASGAITAGANEKQAA